MLGRDKAERAPRLVFQYLLRTGKLVDVAIYLSDVRVLQEQPDYSGDDEKAKGEVSSNASMHAGTGHEGDDEWEGMDEGDKGGHLR
jgi:hypothetical protein